MRVCARALFALLLPQGHLHRPASPAAHVESKTGTMVGLTSRQELVEIRLRNLTVESPKNAVDQALSNKRLHRIVSMSMVSTEEFNTSAVVLILIEYIGGGTSG